TVDLRTDDPPSLEKAAPVQQRVPPAELRQALHERDQCLVLVAQAPANPAQLVVLAVRVVVAALRAPQLVAGEQYPHALRQEQRREEIPLLLRAQREHVGIVGRAPDAAIPA